MKRGRLQMSANVRTMKQNHPKIKILIPISSPAEGKNMIHEASLLGKRNPIRKAKVEIDSPDNEEEMKSLCSSNDSANKKLKVQIKRAKNELLEDVKEIVYSDKTPAEIIAQLREFCAKAEEQKDDLTDLYSTQEDSVLADSDLCNFSIITSSDFL